MHTHRSQGPQRLAPNPFLHNAAFLLGLTALVTAIGAIGGSVVGGTIATAVGGVVAFGLVAALLIVLVGRYAPATVDLTAGTIATGPRTTPLPDVDAASVSPAPLGFGGHPGKELVLGSRGRVVTRIYLHGAPLRRLPRSYGETVAATVVATSAPTASDVVEVLISLGLIERPDWFTAPAPGSAEANVRYLVVGAMGTVPHPDGLGRIGHHVGVGRHVVESMVRGDAPASGRVVEGLARAGVDVRLLTGPVLGDDTVAPGQAASYGTDTTSSPIAGEAARDEYVRALAVLATGERDLTAVTAADGPRYGAELARLLDPDRMARMMTAIGELSPAKREKALARSPGLRVMWEQFGNG